MPLKLLGALALILAGFVAGRMRTGRLQARRTFLRDMQGFLSSLSTALRFQGTDIFRSVSSSGGLFAAAHRQDNEPFDTMWERVTSGFPRRYALNAQDVSLLRELGAQLGKTDVEGQLQHIELYRTLFAKQLASAEEDVRQKAKLYQTLGLFVGVSAAIVLL